MRYVSQPATPKASSITGISDAVVRFSEFPIVVGQFGSHLQFWGYGSHAVASTIRSIDLRQEIHE
jgi:hypothetical protein